MAPQASHDTSQTRLVLPAPTPLTRHIDSQHSITKRHISRPRAQRSCETCRRRKIRCDKLHPVCKSCSTTLRKCTYNNGHSLRKPIAFLQRSNQNVSHQSSTGEGDRVRGNASQAAEGAEQPPVGDVTPKGSIETRLNYLSSMVEALTQSGQLGKFRDHGRTTIGGSNLHKEPVIKAQDQQQSRNSPTRSSALLCAESSCAALSQPRNDDNPLSSPDSEFDLPAGGQEDDLFGDLNVGHLSIQDEGPSRQVGTTYWAYMCDRLDQLNQRLHTQDQPLPLLNTMKDNRPQFEQRSSQILMEMTEGLPTKSQSHVLFRCWYSGVQHFNPLFHPPTLLAMYQVFWRWYDHKFDSNHALPDPQYVPLFFAIWHAGSVSISSEGLSTWFQGTSRETLSAHLHGQVTKCLSILSFPLSASLPALSAFLTDLTIREREQDALTTGIDLGLALRVSQTMGLHRDPDLFNLPPWEIETRRLIWWCIMTIDSALAFATGIPALMDDRYFWDTKNPMEVNEIGLEPLEAAEHEAGVRANGGSGDSSNSLGTGEYPSVAHIHKCTSRGKFILSSASRKLMKIRLGTRRITRVDIDEIRSILRIAQSDVRGIIDHLPSERSQVPGITTYHDGRCQSLTGDTDSSMAHEPTQYSLELRSLVKESPAVHTASYHSNCIVSFCKWFRMYLSLVIDMLYCMSYQPFLKSSKSELWPLARPSALRHCHDFIRTFIKMATEPEFQPFRWKRPGTHQPMHPSVIMLVDLYDRPDSQEAPVSRMLIDQLFSMARPDAVMIGSGRDSVTAKPPPRESGHEEWNMLYRLRQRAWQKAGVDPSFFWTREEQTQGGSRRLSKPPRQHERVAKPSQIQRGLCSQAVSKTNPSFSEPAEWRGTSLDESIVRSSPRPFGEPVSIQGRTIPNSASYLAPSKLVQPYVDPIMVASSAPSLHPSIAQAAPDSLAVLTESPDDKTSPNSSQGSELLFDWNEWDAVFGQPVPVDFAMDWESIEIPWPGSFLTP